MAITAITRDSGLNANIVRITSTDTLAEVAATDYILDQMDNIIELNNGPFDWLANDTVLVTTTDGNQFFEFADDDFNTLIPMAGGAGTVILPVVAGDFVNFASTSGDLRDDGYSPTDATKTKVVMANGAVIADYMAVYKDTAGTIGINATTAINGGSIQAGLSGTAGNLTSYPAVAASGFFRVQATTNASGNFNTIITNASAIGQTQTITIPNGSQAASNFIISNSATQQVINTGSLFINQGDIRVGSDGFARSVFIFPSTTDRGNLRFSANNNVGDTSVTVNNASHGQASVYSIPDTGQATSEFVMADSAGTQHITSGSLEVDAGNISAGSDANAGTFVSYPTTTGSGTLIIGAQDNAGAFNVTIQNSSHGQSSVYNIPDVGEAIGSLLVTRFDAASPNMNSNIDISFPSFSTLSGAQQVQIIDSTGSQRYRIYEIFLCAGGTNFSGGDRALNITDGTTIYTTIPAVTLQALVNARWGSTEVPFFPISGNFSTATVAGTDLYAQYDSAGTTDYTAGSLTLVVYFVRAV